MTLRTVPIGHVATSVIRDAIENAVSGSLDEGESLSVSVDGDGEIGVRVTSERDLKENELASYAEAIRNVASDCLAPGELIAASGFEAVEVARPAL